MRKYNYDEGFQEVARQLDCLKGRVQQLERIIVKMAGGKDSTKDLNRYEAHNNYILTVFDLPEDFKKMKELTKVDDYEYTSEIKKLVKKIRKQAKDE